MNHKLQLLQRFVKHVRVFSPWYALIELLTVIDRPISLKINKPFSHRLLALKERYIMKWLRITFANEIAAYQQKTPASPSTKTSNSPIWICWLQGEQNAPTFVKQMITHIKANANGHPVTFISLKNYKDYCDIPDNIIRKYEKGLMPQQQFADILRSGLLSQKGGLWIDASVLVTDPIPEQVFQLPIYNVKNIKPNAIRDAVSCDATQWQAYFIASQPHSVTYSFIFDCFIAYWKRYNTLIDYFLFSYLAKAAREDIPGARAEYEQIPDNNPNCELLSDYLMNPIAATDKRSQSILNSSNFIYKLTWKGIYPLLTQNSEPTLAAKILNEPSSDAKD